MAQVSQCVIFNPEAGKGGAARRLAGLREKADTLFLPTEHPGHAVQLAKQAALDGTPLVVAAGGDGTVHEVANGLLQAARPDIRFGLFPIGSANDYAHSVQYELTRDGKHALTVDVGRVRTADGREEFFVCCLGLGLNGAVTLESRGIRRLQGIALYGLAALRALWSHYQTPLMQFQFDDEPTRTEPTLMISVLVGRREGGFVIAPNARLDDGWLDYLHAGSLSRWEVVRLLPRLARTGPPAEYPKIRQGRCRWVHLTSETPLIVHVDGEFLARPEDQVRELTIDIIPAALRVEMFP